MLINTFDVYAHSPDEVTKAKVFAAQHTRMSRGVPVIVRSGDIRSYLVGAGYDVIVTPGNSYGIMTGGYDEVVASVFAKYGIQDLVYKHILGEFFGECPVGQAFNVPVGNTGVVVSYAPTMRAPKRITDPKSDVPYLATRACLLDLARTIKKDRPLKVLFPMMCVGTGGMPVNKVLYQMYAAVRSMVNPPMTNIRMGEGMNIDKSICG